MENKNRHLIDTSKFNIQIQMMRYFVMLDEVKGIKSAIFIQTP